MSVPATVMNDLKAAKTMIGLASHDSKKGDVAPRVEQYLSSVESFLVTAAQGNFPPERIDEWLQRLEEATSDVCCEEKEPRQESRFISGLPRDQKWIRVNPSQSLPIERLKELAEEANLSFRTEKDGHFIVYGKPEKIREYVKKMADKA